MDNGKIKDNDKEKPEGFRALFENEFTEELFSSCIEFFGEKISAVFAYCTLIEKLIDADGKRSSGSDQARGDIRAYIEEVKKLNMDIWRFTLSGEILSENDYDMTGINSRTFISEFCAGCTKFFNGRHTINSDRNDPIAYFRSNKNFLNFCMLSYIRKVISCKPNANFVFTVRTETADKKVIISIVPDQSVDIRTKGNKGFFEKHFFEICDVIAEKLGIRYEVTKSRLRIIVDELLDGGRMRISSKNVFYDSGEFSVFGAMLSDL